MSQPATQPGFYVLVVSADISIRETKTFMLERAGYLVHAVASRAQAEPLLGLVKFDAVIVDHTLKQDERVTLIRAVREAKSRSRILVLHRSGSDCGADAHFDSREGPDQLLDHVRKLLDPSLRPSP